MYMIKPNMEVNQINKNLNNNYMIFNNHIYKNIDIINEVFII